MHLNKINRSGFTLIELLIALALSGIVMVAIYAAFSSQEEANLAQQEIFEMQQNLRAGLYIMASEIRMAGFDKTLLRRAEAGIVTARSNLIRFTGDFNETEVIGDDASGEPSEDISYSFSNEYDEDGDGIADDGVAKLGRQTCTDAGTCGGFQPVAQNIEGIRFIYGYDSDDDGAIDGWGIDSTGGTDLDIAGTDDVPLDDIVAVRVSILGRTNRAVLDGQGPGSFNLHGVDFDGNAITIDGDNGSYNPGVSTYESNRKKYYARRLLTTTVKCRNMVF